jgi:hypothetical protein
VDNQPYSDDDDNGNATAVEQAFAGLLHAVLSADERQLLAAFDAIPDAKVRHALIVLACDAAGFDSDQNDDSAALPRVPERAAPHTAHSPTPTGSEAISLRRVRRQLLTSARVGKGRP